MNNGLRQSRKKNMENREKTGQTVFLKAAGAAFIAAGSIFIPPLIRKYGSRVYKASLKREVIDFDNMQPEIVPHEITEGE